MAITIARLALAAFFISAGILHFTSPGPYVAIVPAWLPWALTLVYISGAAEIAGGIGVLAPEWRHAAGWGLIALLIAVFPANVNMALHRLPMGGTVLPEWALWARLPLQGVIIGWVYWACLWRTK